MRVTVSCLAAALLLLNPCVQAESNLDQPTLQQLERLEQKYFGRSYSNESDSERAERLEKLVFGEASEGDPATRIKKIVGSTGGETAPSPPVAPPATSESNSQPDQTERPPEPSKVDSYTSTKDYVEDPYPRVTELENAILGQTYTGEQVTGRIARMEMKAFGHTTNDPDLSARADALEQYAEQKLHKRAAPTPNNEVTEEGQSGAQSTEYPRIDALEVAILGQKYVADPLPDRLKRMEVKAFGSQSTSVDFSQRTDALERYAEKTLHKKPLEPGNDSPETVDHGSQNGSSKSSQFLSKIGKSLLGMAGGGASFGRGGIGPGFMGAPGYMGMGPGLSPFGGASQSQNRDLPEEESKTRNEDPAVADPSPPPANARLITKVGWCEMQIFGHSSPELHLEQRLALLNERLNFAPGKSNLELMDHISDLMKVVIAQKQPSKPVASSSKMPVR